MSSEPSFFVLLSGTALFVLFAGIGYLVGTLIAERAFHKRVRRAKALYSQHSEHTTDCPIYKELVVTDILLQWAEDELRSIKHRAEAA